MRKVPKPFMDVNPAVKVKVARSKIPPELIVNTCVVVATLPVKVTVIPFSIVTASPFPGTAGLTNVVPDGSVVHTFGVFQLPL